MTLVKFLYKEKDSEDRDCCKYIDLNFEFECGHYFTGVRLTGPCFSTSIDYQKPIYENIKTVLTKLEFNTLIQFDKAISELGYGIVKDDDRYKKGIELQKSIIPIINRLKSGDNEKLFDEIIEEEREYMQDEYSLNDEDIDLIFEKYYLEYRDRGIISYVFDDIDDAAYEEAFSIGYATKNNENWFNFKEFGESLLEEDQYVELSDGRIVYLNY